MAMRRTHVMKKSLSDPREIEQLRILNKRTDSIIGDEVVRGVKVRFEIQKVTGSEKPKDNKPGFVLASTDKRLDDIEKRFRRARLFDYLRKLKTKEAKNTAKFFRVLKKPVISYHAASPSGIAEWENPWDDTLIVYGPRSNSPERSWEVKCLVDLSKKASEYYGLALFFMTGDRTVGWWSPKNPQFLAVCFLRGFGNRVTGIRGCGRVSMSFEPDAIFRGYVEMIKGAELSCRLGHVDDLYEFGSDGAHSTFAYLVTSLLSACIGCSLMMLTRCRSSIGDKATKPDLLMSELEKPDVLTSELALVGLLCILGQQHWPGVYDSLRTCFLGALGGVTGILVSKKQRSFSAYVKGVELPCSLLVSFVVGGTACHKYLVTLTCLVVVPVYWSAVFRNRAGEGYFWRRLYRDRQFFIADSVPSGTTMFGRRPVFTRRSDYCFTQETAEDEDHSEDEENSDNDIMDKIYPSEDKPSSKDDQTGYDVSDETRYQSEEPVEKIPPPAYTRGFGSWDISSFGVGKTPGEPWAWESIAACGVLIVEVLLVVCAFAIGTIGSGLGIFLGSASLYDDDNEPGMFLRGRERFIGLLSGFLSALALTGVLAPVPESTELVVFGLTSDMIHVCFFGGAATMVWAAFGFFFNLVMRLCAWCSYKCFLVRHQLASSARFGQDMKLVNRSSSGAWRSMNRCRRTVQTTFPRVDGYSYYDGELYNVHSGWYFPACGRVALSVPRSKGYCSSSSAVFRRESIFRASRSRSSISANHDEESDDNPRFVSFDRTGDDGMVLGPSTKKEKLNAIQQGHDDEEADESDQGKSDSKYDVFLVHTGKDKDTIVDCMKRFFTDAKLKCFLDQDDLKDGHPANKMQLALETSRHAVVVVSEAFLNNRTPRMELAYAFKRMVWLRKRDFGWESLIVVLFDLTTESYNEARRLHKELPDLGRATVMFEFRKNYKKWSELCDEIVARITKEDDSRGLTNWQSFLRGRRNRTITDFPPADEVYTEQSSHPSTEASNLVEKSEEFESPNPAKATMDSSTIPDNELRTPELPQGKVADNSSPADVKDLLRNLVG